MQYRKVNVLNLTRPVNRISGFCFIILEPSQDLEKDHPSCIALIA